MDDYRRYGLMVMVLLLAGCSPSSWNRDESCLAGYPAQWGSSYVLPYEHGRSFVVATGNCGEGHSRYAWDQFAYDFAMPIGTPIMAAREGEVIRIEERFADGTRIPGQENQIVVRHADDTVAVYLHLTTNGAWVMAGDRVARGQVIGLSGDSGNSREPHLHFHVQACVSCGTVAITFRNTRPHPWGLIAGESYRAD